MPWSTRLRRLPLRLAGDDGERIWLILALLFIAGFLVVARVEPSPFWH